MKRISCSPRRNWESTIASLGLTFNNIPVDGKVVPYWIDDAVYWFSPDTIEQIETASTELHKICLDLVDQACRHEELMQLLHIPQSYWSYIRASWSNRAPSLYGRFDLCYDPSGAEPVKMYEYNADTPTILIESSLAQANWLDEQCENIPDVDQFNQIHSKLVKRWREILEKSSSTTVHLSCVPGHEEDLKTVEYLASTANEAGWDVRLITIDCVGWDSERQTFVDMLDEPIKNWFKLYPWEGIVAEEFGPHMLTAKAPQTIEPVWKMILSNKASLPLLWKLNEGHPNLLAAYFTEEEAKRNIKSGSYAAKPLFGREGANIRIQMDGEVLETSTGIYGSEPLVYQECKLPPKFDDFYAVIGSWIVGDSPAGICVREDVSPITKNISRFVPHVFG